MDHDFEGPVAKEMVAKQHQVMQALIEKLGPDASEEDNLNGSMII